jgi:hypothetical protein
MDREPLIFAFGVHNHQPVGNSASVIEEVYKKAYLPFFRLVSGYPGIHLSVHVSGYLLEWLERRGRELFETLRTMIQRGQVDILTGTYYESVVSLIPEHDAIDSIKAYSDHLDAAFGVRPRGMWLAERVYEPYLPRILARAGVEYLALDEWHFRTVGLAGRDLNKPWIAEEELERVTVFPICQWMRRSVPFGKTEENVEYLRGLYDDGAAFVCFAEDGEKFGGRPGTTALCYDEGWLEDFFRALTGASDWLRVASLGEAYDEVTPAGPVYLPNTSYYEMGRWALPADEQINIEKLGADFTVEGPYGHLIPGAPFRSFLGKYPESNYVHKRMEATSRRLAELEAGGSEKPEIRRRLWRSQANDAYWHGVSGGLYLPHFRRAVMEDVLATERSVDSEISMDTFSDATDFDYDGSVEVTLKDRRQVLVLVPDEGLAAKEWSFFDGPVCLTGVLARRVEPYHVEIGRELEDGKAHGGEDRREYAVIYDTAPKRFLLDRFFPVGATENDYWSQNLPEYVPPGSAEKIPFEVERAGRGTARSVNANFSLAAAGDAVMLSKKVSAGEKSVFAEWEFEAAAGRFGTELSVSLVSPAGVFVVSSNGDSAAIGLEEPGAATGRKLEVSDEFAEWRLLVESDRLVDVWQYPVYTVSRSESGYEKIYQGTTFFLSFMVEEGETGSWMLKLKADV